ncbi:hypothetical protein LCGC14_0714740 [marine sediment metagenome]|uniref:Calcineurin-like phosphoesterase domain-containing protein n=1 Tax=marine sediment metagenome TaxID=412755 RepID=A0A0F9QIH8_9ZZZZ
MNKTITLIFIFALVCVLNVSSASDVNVSDFQNLWWFNDTITNVHTARDYSANVNHATNNSDAIIEQSSSNCQENFTNCGFTDGSDAYFRAESNVFDDNENHTFFCMFKPTQAEATFDIFCGDNDAFYMNDNGADIQLNTRDGGGFDSFDIVTNYDTTNNTWYFLWGTNNGTHYCGYNTSGVLINCSTFDGTFQSNNIFEFGGAGTGASARVYSQAAGVWNRRLNQSEMAEVYKQVVQGNRSILNGTLLASPISPTTLNWTFRPKNGFLNTSAQIITYQSDNPSNYSIEWGTTISYGNFTSLNNSATFYDIILDSLSSDTTYFYQLIVNNSNVSLTWASNFTTMPSTNRDFKFCQLSDIHIGNTNWEDSTPRLRRILNFCSSENVDFITFTGDTHEGTSFASSENNLNNFSKILSEEVPHIPFLATTGNHDPADGDGGNNVVWKRFWTNPTNGKGNKTDGNHRDLGNETVWAFNYSYGCFVAVSNNLNLSNKSSQFNFINDSLQSCGTDNWFRVVLEHSPYNFTGNKNWMDWVDIYRNTSALKYAGDFHSAGYNLSLNQLRASPIYDQFDGFKQEMADYDEWNNNSKAFFSMTTVNASTARVEFYNDTPTIIQTFFWNNSNFVASSTDTTQPSFANNQTNASASLFNSGTVQINLTIEDDSNISAYTLTHNDTTDGTFTNETIVNLAGDGNVTIVWNYTITNFPTNGGKFGWQIWANDTLNNVNVSQIYTFQVQNSSGLQPRITGQTSRFLRTALMVIIATAILVAILAPIISGGGLSLAFIITILLISIIGLIALSFIQNLI